MKEMILRIWKKWFGKEAEQVLITPRKEPNPLPMLEKMGNFLFSRFDFRYNLLFRFLTT